MLYKQLFGLAVGKYTNISNIQQLSLCVHTVDNILNVKENFLDFYESGNIKSDTIIIITNNNNIIIITIIIIIIHLTLTRRRESFT